MFAAVALFAIFYAFLFAGSVVYVVMIPVPHIRRYALSAALGVATFGAASLGMMMLAGLSAVLQSFVRETGYLAPRHLPNLEAFGTTFLVLGILGSAIAATGVAVLHQILIHRLTLFLFRLYATTVSAGIGGTFAIGLGWFLAIAFDQEWPVAFMLLAPILAALLGTFAYRAAPTFRGGYPEHLPWVTPEEFSGLPTT